MNRYFRRLRRFGEGSAATPTEGARENTGREPFDRSRPQDVASVRAKNSRHGKVTADTWNQ